MPIILLSSLRVMVFLLFKFFAEITWQGVTVTHLLLQLPHFHPSLCPPRAWGLVEHYINGLDIRDFVTGAAQPKLSQANMNRIPIPFPPLDVQRRIVAEIEAEQVLVEANRDLIARMEAKIKAKLAEIWGAT